MSDIARQTRAGNLAVLRSAPKEPDSSQGTADDTGREQLPRLATLLQLLRQELELMPGVRVPPLDSQLSAVAARALSGAVSA